ncbi:hypothetical protein [Bordetella petrii]|uniref:hypothetical protein n=1 Tax=Bordetella petrii TaxID=94624 RepID=UPI00372DAC13
MLARRSPKNHQIACKTILAMSLGMVFGPSSVRAEDMECSSGTTCIKLTEGAVRTTAAGVASAGADGSHDTGRNGKPGGSVELLDQGAVFNLDPAAGGFPLTSWTGVMYATSTGGDGSEDEDAGAAGGVRLESAGQVNLVVGDQNGLGQVAAVLYGKSSGGHGDSDEHDTDGHGNGNTNNDTDGGHGGAGNRVDVRTYSTSRYQVAGKITSDMSGIFAASAGGDGGEQNSSDLGIGNQVGGAGGIGDDVYVLNAGSFIFAGDALAGGTGGKLTINDNVLVGLIRGDSHGGKGGPDNGAAGSGGDVRIDHQAGLLQLVADGASGTTVYGLRATSEGGEGDESNDSSDPGGQGGQAGHATIYVSSAIEIDVSHAKGAAIQAVSQGGRGGDGPRKDKSGGAGGAGGDVYVSLSAATPYTIRTAGGSHMYGVEAQSKGGFGGSGNDSLALAGEPGGAGQGGDAGDVAVDIGANVAISTGGDYSSGVVAYSVGGGGGTGGDFYAILGGGGKGGDGGESGTATVHNSGAIQTVGGWAFGIDAQSNAGGGGAGGITAGIVSVGGDGGIGGKAGNVDVVNFGSIATQGYGAIGLSAQAAGGGGGNAGVTAGVVAVGGGSYSSLAGSSSQDADGGIVYAWNSGIITTQGDAAPAISAQSIGGGGGNASGNFGIITVGATGGAGGDGDAVHFDGGGGQLGTLQTSGDFSYGVIAQSIGGGGGNGGDTLDVGILGAVSVGASGGPGGDGGTINFQGTEPATITTAGQNAHGILAQSIGGGGGTGGDMWHVGLEALAVLVGGQGGDGGDGHDVDLDWRGLTVNTYGSAARGVALQSIGGGGGSAGGLRADVGGIEGQLIVGVGGSGGDGGNGGDVYTRLGASSIHTHGPDASDSGNDTGNGGQTDGDGYKVADASAVVAQSIGGGGGSGGNVKDQSAMVGVIFTEIGTAAAWENLIMVGGQGGNGGDGGKVDTAVWDSALGTEGQFSHGVFAQSVGGGGGDGGSASTFSVDAVIGLQSINVQDEAAVGGRCITSDDGDNSCGGGNGGEVNVNLGDGDGAGRTVVRTSGDYSNGVLAQSIGGGGGDGGSANAYAFDFETGAAISVDALVSVGAKGGKGGDGGAVTVATLDDTHIRTTGSGARGIVAQSIGGGGGTGQGTAVFLGAEGQVTKALEAGFSVDVGVGMTGGEGGNAGQATVNNFGHIVTTGRDSDGVLVQSIGGGGGVGGSMGADEGDILDNVFNAIKALLDHNPFTLNGSITVNVGGRGGTGGDGAAATLHQYGVVSTSGDYADGVVVQSIGGGGGAGGGSYSQNYEDWLDLNIAVGGRGGTGGKGGQASVTLERTALVQTQGYGAYGVLAQSIGGGGGQGGSGTLATKGRLEIGAGVGGTGGDGNDGGTVLFQSDSSNRIQTFGEAAHAIALQSIGGGGGTGGLTQGVGGTRIGTSLNFTVSVGGSGGDGGDGGVVDMCASAGCRPVDIYTGGHMASGVVAQSIGGGGGIGSVGSPDQKPGLATSFSLDLLLGGAGGNGGDGGTVNIGGEHDITTRGDFSHGIVAQSLGGGGGMAGINDPLGLDFSLTPPSAQFQLVVTLGSMADGHAGDGGVVDVASRGEIVTLGDGSHALVAQSIGGGGGMMGAVLKDDDDSDAPDGWPDDVEIERSLTLGAGGDAVGTAAGSSGDAAGSETGASLPVVRVSHDGTLATSGAWAMGVLAQSIGGGGGVGHAGLAVDGTFDNGAASIQVGSLGRTGGAGGVTVDVSRQGGKLLTTTGAGAYGVLAQSISQGGGLGTGMVADSAAVIQVGGGSDTIKVASGDAAGDVSVNVHTNVLTWGDDAIGIAAQSIGGGGGVGGVQALEGTRLDGARLRVGGYMAGQGGAVSLASDWTVNTAGDGAHGIVAQSIGGGGGIGVIGLTDSASPDGTTVLIGGYDPANEDDDIGDNGAGHIDLDLDGVISTGGAGAHGVVAQAIGGGGGLGGATGSTASGTMADAANAPYNVSLLVGGSAAVGAGGAIGSADDYARLAARVTTYGDFSDAVLLQSIGSGGGLGGASASGPAPISLDLRVGGNSKPATATSADQSGGGAIAVEFDPAGDNNAAFTYGYGANGVLVQSIGGGGGVAASVAAGGTGTVRVGGSNGAWGAGGHIQVSPSSWVRAGTKGQSAHGLVVQSIGGGGGLATVYSGDAATGVVGQFGLALGAGQAGSGDGGKVELTTGGDLTTEGKGSIAIIAQSVGGGGGIVSAGDGAALSSVSLGGDKDVQGNGGEVSVALTGGTVTTSGAGAHGVVAQSVGGGGGIAGDLAQAISLDRDGWAKTSGQVSGTGADVAVVIQNTVVTRGANAHGVIAQSIGGGGGLAGAAQGGFAGSVNAADGNTENWAGHVDVTVDGSVSATGDGSTGVFAQSEGSDEKGFPVTVTVNGTVAGGSGSGAGVWVAGNGVGASLVEIGTEGVVTALSGVAVRYDGTAGMNVRNHGLMEGGTQCDNPGPCAIENTPTGKLVGASLYQADVTNAGHLTVGSAGRFGRLTVSGDYTQASSGVLRADIDFAAMRAAHMTVQGDAQLDGQFELAATSLLPGRELAVLDVEGTSTGALQAKDSPIFDFAVRQVGKQQRVSVQGADFNAASQDLARNQRAVAGHLQEIWDQGGTLELAPLFAVLNTAASHGSGAYREKLTDLSPGVSLAPAAQMAAGMARFTGSMMSCPDMAGAGTDGREQDCFWGQVSRRSADQDAVQGTPGYSFDSNTYQVGGQREFRPGWFIGGSAAYQNNSLRADNGRAGGSGDAGYAGVVLKHQAGPWVYAAAIGGGYGSYDLDRSLGIDGYDRQASSSPDVYSAGLRLRVSRHIGITEQFYLKPYVDLDALYARMPGYTESGGPLSLEVDSSDQFVVGLSPMLEVGGRVDLPDGATMRPYAYAGASFLSDDSWDAQARFKGAPAGSDGFRASLPGDDVIGRFGVGVQVNNRSGLDFRLQYDGEVSSHTTSHAGQLKVIYRF